jgi:hypothetical protein
MIFTAGLLVASIRNESKRNDLQDLRLDGHDSKIELAALSIARLEAWRDGYNAAVSRHPELKPEQ